jgi:purine-binding chemotaxis protein CheW
MLKRDVTKILKSRAKELKESQELSHGSSNLDQDHYFILEFGEQLIALHESDVDEIQDELRITPVPNVQNKLLGVINVRGQIVSILDLNPYLNVSSEEYFEKTKAKTVIIETERYTSGILVSDVIEKVAVLKGDVEIIKTDQDSSEYINSVIPFLDQKVGVLDIRRILNKEELIINHE